MPAIKCKFCELQKPKRVHGYCG